MAYVGIGRLLVTLGEIAVDSAASILLLHYYMDSVHDVAAPDWTWRRLQATITRDNGEDVCVNTYDIVNITSGHIDGTWTTTDYTNCEAKFTTFYNAVKTYLGKDAHTLTYRWYSYPRVPHDGRPPERIYSPVTDLTPIYDILPEQVAFSCTKVVPARRHWGRVYLGPMATQSLDTIAGDGRWSHSTVDGIGAAWNTLWTDLQASDYPMVVYDSRHGLLQAVVGARVDNVPDIIRRRRAETSLYRKVYP